MDTFCREYFAAIFPTDEARGFAEDVLHWTDLFDIQDTFSVCIPAYLSFHDIYDTDRARMTGMLDA